MYKFIGKILGSRLLKWGLGAIITGVIGFFILDYRSQDNEIQNLKSEVAVAQSQAEQARADLVEQKRTAERRLEMNRELASDVEALRELERPEDEMECTQHPAIRAVIEQLRARHQD